MSCIEVFSKYNILLKVQFAQSIIQCIVKSKNHQQYNDIGTYLQKPLCTFTGCSSFQKFSSRKAVK